MTNTFLPGTVRDRIADLMKYYKVSQTDLALKIGCGDSLLSRFLTGKTDKLGDENIIRIARAFNVSTDFLLGIYISFCGIHLMPPYSSASVRVKDTNPPTAFNMRPRYLSTSRTG